MTTDQRQPPTEETSELVERVAELRQSFEDDLEAGTHVGPALDAALRSADLAPMRAALATLAAHAELVDPGLHADALLHLVRTADAGTRLRAARLLAQAEIDFDATAIVDSLTTSTQLEMRAIALPLLLATNEHPFTGREDELIARLLSDPEPGIVTATLTQLAQVRLGPVAVDQVLHELEHGDGTRAPWHVALERLERKPQRLVLGLLHLFEDSEHPASQVAGRALTRGVVTEAKSSVVDAALRELSRSATSERRRVAVDMLSGAATERARAELARLADDPEQSATLRRHAADATDR